MSSFLKKPFVSDNETMHYQSPFKIPIQTSNNIKQFNNNNKNLNYDADTEYDDIVINKLDNSKHSYHDSQFFIFDIEL